MGIGPGERIRMFELAVLRVWSANREPHTERAGGHIAAWADVVTGEHVDRAAEHEAVFRDPEDTVTVELVGQGFFDVRTRYRRAPGDIIPSEQRKAGAKVGQKGLAPFVFVRRPGRGA